MHFPINVILFNRPEEARRTLESLLQQTSPVPQEQVTLSVDGYQGSKDEATGQPDRTSEVAAIARNLFPRSTVVEHDQNLGIARHFDEVERRSFDDSLAEWSFFLEGDYVLAPRHMEALLHAIAAVGHDDRVAVVSVTGDALGDKHRGPDSLYPMDHAWAFALRRSHHHERQPHIQKYLGLMEGVPYFERDYEKVTTGMAEAGILTLGSSQDYVKQAIRGALGRLAVTTGRNYGQYIGVNGEHFSPDIYESLGYHLQPPPDTILPTIPDCSESFVQLLIDEQRILVARESLLLAGARVDGAIAWAHSALEARDAAHHAEIQMIQQRLETVEFELHMAKEQLTTLYESNSWKVTRPFRTVRQIFPL